MKTSTLLRLYPRAWRARYGDEVLAMCGERALTFQQTLDLLAGAVDARLGAPVSHGEEQMTTGYSTVGFVKRACASPGQNYTTRDGLVSAGVIVAGSFLFAAIGILMSRNGWHEAGEFFKSVGFPVSLLYSSNFTFMKGQPRRVRVVILGGTIALVSLMGLLAARL